MKKVMLARVTRLAVLRFWKTPISDVTPSAVVLSESTDRRAGSNAEEPSPSSKSVEQIASPSDAKSEATTPSYLGYLSGVVTSLWKSEQPTEDEEVQKKRVSRVVMKHFSRSEVTNRAQSLVNKLIMAQSSDSIRLRAQELCKHFVEYPATRVIAVQNKRFMKTLLSFLHNTSDEEVKGDIRQCLSVMGYVDFPKGAGVRILSIDGGGTRGMMGLEILQALEDALHGPKLAEMFDHIVGVSTGAIIAVLLGAKELSIERCKEIYVEISRELFNQGRISGVSGLLLSHSYYNTKKWRKILKKRIGEEETMLDSCRRKGAPKLSVVSCIVNAPMLQPYIFRNYVHPPGRESHFKGGCEHMLWQALQASAAAPGYFEEVALGSILHQDGGVLANNPTALALHEARMLWPNERIQCVVSVGNGHHVNELETTNVKLSTRIQEKITRIVDSATDTELVHLCMHDLLPANTYFRLNPYMSFPYTLDEIDPKKLAQMENDARLYVRRNRAKIEAAAEALLLQPSITQTISRRLRELAQRSGLYVPSF
uniref:Calcium-independent phospholipase A2-gamma n=2 Tax=Ascaris TaxID=6251 RepID=F1L089_ASCSU